MGTFIFTTSTKIIAKAAPRWEATFCIRIICKYNDLCTVRAYSIVDCPGNTYLRRTYGLNYFMIYKRYISIRTRFWSNKISRHAQFVHLSLSWKVTVYNTVQEEISVIMWYLLRFSLSQDKTAIYLEVGKIKTIKGI